METSEQVLDALAFLRGLVARPDSLVAIKLRETNDIVVVERGAASEGDWVAVRLLPERRTVMERLTNGRVSSARNTKSGTQVLGRVLSVIHPARPYAQPQGA